MKKCEKFDEVLEIAANYIPNIIQIESLPGGSNNVYKLRALNKKEYVFKEYINRGSQKDSEIQLYELLNHPEFLRKSIAMDLTCSQHPYKFGIFEYIEGKTLFEIIEDNELSNYDQKNIVEQIIAIIDAFEEIKVSRFGKVDLVENLMGDNLDWVDFLTQYHQSSIDRLSVKYPEIANRAQMLLKIIQPILEQDKIVPVMIPCDLNSKNFLLLDDGKVCLLSGTMMSADKDYGYAQFLSHLYKTSLADEMLFQITKDENFNLKMHLYCAISNYNVMAYIAEYTELNPDSCNPWGNTYLYSELLLDHMQALGLSTELDINYD